MSESHKIDFPTWQAKTFRGGKCLGREVGIETVGLPLQRRPGEQLPRKRKPDSALPGGHLGSALRGGVERIARGQREIQLHGPGAVERLVAARERLSRR